MYKKWNSFGLSYPAVEANVLTRQRIPEVPAIFLIVDPARFPPETGTETFNTETASCFSQFSFFQADAPMNWGHSQIYVSMSPPHSRPHWCQWWTFLDLAATTATLKTEKRSLYNPARFFAGHFWRHPTGISKKIEICMYAQILTTFWKKVEIHHDKNFWKIELNIFIAPCENCAWV